MGQHSFIDRLHLLINKNYLYPGLSLQSIIDLNLALLHKPSAGAPNWVITDYLDVKKSSIFNFLCLAKGIFYKHAAFNPEDLVFEVQKAKSDRQINPGDIVLIPKSNRAFLVPHSKI